MSHLKLAQGIEEALIERLKGGQTPSSIGSEIGFIRQAEQLQAEMAAGSIPRSTPVSNFPVATPTRVIVDPIVPVFTAEPTRPLGRPQQQVPPMSIRQSASAFSIQIPGFDLPGGITVNPFQLPIPVPKPRLPVPMPRQPPRIPPVPGRMPFPIPLPIPLGGGGSQDACPRGFHLDKKTRSRCVRNRRMNPLNPRALKKSLRRIDRFEDFVNRTASLTGLRLAKRSTRRKRSCR